MVYPSCFWMTTYRNVTSTVTHVMEFTEECLNVLWAYVHAFLCVSFLLLDTWAKMTRTLWSYILTYTFSKWHLTKRAGNISHNLCVSWYDAAFSKDFQLFNITNFESDHQFTEMLCSKLPPQTQRVIHWRAAFYTFTTLETAIYHKVKRRFRCLWYGGPQ